ncbi:MAG: hypothetical protein L3K06_07285 [Thermoplasmata archaeon]|nr:hypothetical protein [Thermoplasmata archaeon]
MGSVRAWVIGVATFAMVPPPTAERDRLNARLGSIESELSDASRAISGAESEVTSLDASIGALASRLTAVRGRGYCALSHLDKTVDLLTKKWAEVGPAVRQSLANNLQPLGGQIRSLQAEAQSLRSEIDRGNLPMAEAQANRLAAESSSIRSRAADEAARGTAPIKELAGGVSAVDRDLKIAETTVTLFGQAAFPMKQEESPVLAFEGRMMEAEKPHGTLYFTNHRFVFEALKEVVLEKKLFIVTKKRIDRVVTIERPIGALQDITKGRVGLIAGTGVYVQFRPEVGLPVTPFDVRGWEADVITRFFKYITGGEADRDIATVRGVAAPTATTIHLVRCTACGAPHSGEIYRGQTSVNCEYCGSAMAVG